jgi:hypothetical protein
VCRGIPDTVAEKIGLAQKAAVAGAESSKSRKASNLVTKLAQQ